MESLFNIEENKNIVSRIEQLSPMTLSQWGKMTVSQMLAHCQQPIKVPLGKLELKSNWIGFLFGKSMKRKMMSQDSFRHDLPTVKDFRITNEPDFETAKRDLVNLIQIFATEGPASIKNKKHPFFGEMTVEEWDTLQWKHLDHHLRQFGV